MDNEGERFYGLQKVTVRLKLEGEGSLYSKRRIRSPAEAVEVVAEELAGMDREYFCVVNLDAKGTPLNYNVVSIGNTAEVHVPIQNVFKTAVLSNASQLLLFHNHPSSSLEPSYQDISLTKTLVEASKIMGIPIIDHIIVAGRYGHHTSMAALFPDLFADLEGTRYKAAEAGAHDWEGGTVGEGADGWYSADIHSSEREGQKERTEGNGTDRIPGECQKTAEAHGQGKQKQGAGRTQARRSLRERLAAKAKVAQAADMRQEIERGLESRQRKQSR